MAVCPTESSINTMENVSHEQPSLESAQQKEVQLNVEDAKIEDAQRPLLWQRILAPRNLWGAATGALVAIIICQIATLLFWKLAIYGRFVTVVWGASNETIAWHGALIGFLVGWFGKTRTGFALSCLLGTALLTFYDYQDLRAGFALVSNSLDLVVSFHNFMFCCLVGTFVFAVLKNYDKTQSRRNNNNEERAQR